MRYFKQVANLIQTHPNWPTVKNGPLLTWCQDSGTPKNLAAVPCGTIYAVLLGQPTEWATVTNQAEIVTLLNLHAYTGFPMAAGNPSRVALWGMLKGKTAIRADLIAAISQGQSRLEEAGPPEKAAPSLGMDDLIEVRKNLGG